MAALSDMLTYLRKRKGLTQQQLADQLNMSRSAIGMYETGKREPEIEVLEAFADFYNVDMNTLTGRVPTAPIERDPSFTTSSLIASIPNLMPLPKTQEVPRLGIIACGEPILAQENIENYDRAPEGINCDFTLKCKGDSMIGARINDGDIVYVRQQNEVENGEIAAVLVDDRSEESFATLKRVYLYENQIVLQAENPKYSPWVYTGEDMNKVRIIGKAVAFLSEVQ